MNKKNKTLYDLRKLKQLKKKKVLLYRLYLQGLDNEIEEMGFKEMNIECYRIVDNPATDINFLPQKFKPGREDRLPIIPPEDWVKFNSKYKKRHISNCTLSHFMTEEDCRKMINERFNKDVLRMGKEKATRRKKNLGTHIIKMKYKKGDGLWGNQDQAHIEFLPYEGIDFKKRIDYDFGYKEI